MDIVGHTPPRLDDEYLELLYTSCSRCLSRITSASAAPLSIPRVILSCTSLSSVRYCPTGPNGMDGAYAHPTIPPMTNPHIAAVDGCNGLPVALLATANKIAHRNAVKNATLPIYTMLLLAQSIASASDLNSPPVPHMLCTHFVPSLLKPFILYIVSLLILKPEILIY